MRGIFMYFTKVELHNFGIYKGTHEMPLTNRIGNRNIILVGGLNGRGKTTFHDAILIALYGKLSLKYIQENARSYDKFLQEHINKQATDNETYVAVVLVLDDGTQLRVKRSWILKGKRIDQSISVEKNGQVDKYLGENWSYYIEEILPFGIARFFFFNNEKITQLADDASFQQIKSSIKSAIGVSTIEKAISHVDEVIRRKKDAIEAFQNSELNQAYQTVEDEIVNLDDRIDSVTKESRELELRCERLAAKLEAEEQRFWSSGGNLSRKRDAIKLEMEKMKGDAARIQSEILSLASDASTPLALCRKLVLEAYEAEETSQQVAVRKYTESIIANIYQNIILKLDQSSLPLKYINQVKDIISDEIHGHRENEIDERHSNISAASMMLFKHLIVDLFQNIDYKIQELIDRAADRESEIESIDAHLGDADDKTLARQLFEAVKDLEKQKGLAESDYQKKLDMIESLKRQREGLVSRRIQLIKDLAASENTNEDDARTVEYAAMSIQALEEFKKRLQRQKIEKLSETVTKCFRQLVEKESLVDRIDIDRDTLDVTIIDVNGQVLLKSQLSAGEQQMFAISIVWALALTSGYKAPVIIDTPMARLDSSHRSNFVKKYLPAASSQVMVLSTDEEINGRYLDMIRGYILQYYTLLYREDEMCTNIVVGYFEESQ